jgi:predicted NACHT family NTPase
MPRGDALISEQAELDCGPIPTEWVHRQLLSGSAILLVDGVDELTSGQRNKVRTWLRAQLGLYRDIRVVVTSRPTAITPKWLATEKFRSVVLEPMNPTDVQVFLQRWHPDDVPKHERSLLAQLQARAHLRAFARNPLLCAMLCALNLDRKAKLPRDRLALYSAALDMLLERRDSDRGVAVGVQATSAEKLVLLRALAWWLNENSRTQMTRDQALNRLRDRLPGMPTMHDDAETLLEHLVQRSGVIRQPTLG